MAISKSIKGLVVEIGGDTSGLQKALQQADKATSSLNKELRAINSSLKFDTKSPELLAQKEQIVNQTIEETKNRINELKKAQSEYIEQGKDLNTPQYRELQREIIIAEEKLKSLQASQDSFVNAGKKIDDLSNSFKSLSSSLSDIGNKLTIGVTTPIAGIVGAGLTASANIEKMTTSMKTFLGSSEEAERVVNQLRETASNTTFDASSFIKANQMLISTGESADEAQKTIKALGDAVVATGGGNDELVRMASNLQQIKNAGKATAMDIRQFAYAGIDIYGLLASSLEMTTEELKDKITGKNAEIEVSYDLINQALAKASEKGGKYYGAIENSSKTLTGQLNKLKASTTNLLVEFTKSLMPVAKDLISKAENLLKKLNTLSDEEKKQIVNIGLIVAAIGPVTKVLSGITGTIGLVTKGVGTLTTAIGVMRTGVASANVAANALASGITALAGPTGIAIASLAALAIAYKALEDAENSNIEKMKSVSNATAEYVQGIATAESHLEAFNSTLFASAEEQAELQSNMQEIQDGITEIARTAAEERRGYTEEEIQQLDEYFARLKELKDREVEIQQNISKAITQQAQTNAETFQGSLEEYKIQSQQWVKTATEQAEKTKALIENGTIEEIAALNQRYGTEATMQNEAYATEYNAIMTQKEAKIQAANDEVAAVQLAYSNGYLERSKQQEGFVTDLKTHLENEKTIQQEYADELKRIETDTTGTYQNESWAKMEALKTLNRDTEKNWKEMYKNMSDSEAEQLGVWLGMVAQTELYGGEIDTDTKELVDGIISSYDEMPEKTKDAMKNAMSPMLTEMEDAEPGLFAKATGIADGILSRLKGAFDIHSPSKETEKIFKNVMLGAEKGLAEETDNLNKQVDNIAKDVMTRYSTIGDVNMGDLQNQIIDQQKFLKPDITFNVQKMDDANLESCFNYINRRFGSAY